MIEFKKIPRRGEGNEAARFEERDARTEKESLADVMSNEDDGFIQAAGEGAEFALKLCTGDGIEGAEWLIHEENGRVGSEGARDADTLALAPGELAGMPCGKLRGV